MHIFLSLSLILMSICVSASTATSQFGDHHLYYDQFSRSNNNRHGEKYLPPPTPSITIPNPLTAPPDPVIIKKRFYFVSAPEEATTETKRTKHFVIGKPRKNYHIVFIKAPSSENANLRLTAESAPQQDRTVIYVLSRKESEVSVEEATTEAPATAPPRPEVFFIKYKTNAEASAAQKEIQDQYEALGGSSEFSDEGVAPIKSVVGSLDEVASNKASTDYESIQGHEDPQEMKKMKKTKSKSKSYYY